MHVLQRLVPEEKGIARLNLHNTRDLIKIIDSLTLPTPHESLLISIETH